MGEAVELITIENLHVGKVLKDFANELQSLMVVA